MENDFFKVSLKLVGDKVKLVGKARDNDEIIMDYFPPLGKGEGYAPLEMFLLSFTECFSMSVLALLTGSMSKTVSAFSANASGIQKEEAPKHFSKINIELIFESDDLDDEIVKKAIAIAEEKVCAVSAMIKGNVETFVRYEIKRKTL